ncbi:uncharacterized protein LOC125868098 isoform X1 [Solanum stenotomum]|uniref:uncharacterized protein LOC125868098 isoform X1 n=1 Tax=Solanum stenotomum TaxID=172797 RepID=UPI0020D02E78|nr:uncharacterized protein LOC125868098 isoform X1 [Solanum stenotomum]XP_049404659.1 uncharacterized protein LOC125868098 isoform X1 [Solanum stenotomum]
MKSHSLHFHGLSILFLLPIIFTLIIYPSFHLALFHPDYNFHQLDSHYLPRSSFEIVIPILYTLCLSLFYLCAVATITHSAAQALCDKPISLLCSVKSIRNSFFPLLSTFILTNTILISIALIFVLVVVFLVQTLRSIGLIELKYDLNHFLYLCFFSLIVLVPILVWLQVNWLLAYVIAVLESKSGFEALRRSADLLKGKRWIASYAMLYGMPLMGLLVVTHSIVSVMAGVAHGSLVAIVVAVAGSFMMNHYILENVALYMYCKDEFFNGEKSPLEIGDKFTGASELCIYANG